MPASALFQRRPEREAGDVLEYHERVARLFVARPREFLNPFEACLAVSIQMEKRLKESRAAAGCRNEGGDSTLCARLFMQLKKGT